MDSRSVADFDQYVPFVPIAWLPAKSLLAAANVRRLRSLVPAKPRGFGNAFREKVATRQPKTVTAKIGRRGNMPNLGSA